MCYYRRTIWETCKHDTFGSDPIVFCSHAVSLKELKKLEFLVPCKHKSSHPRMTYRVSGECKKCQRLTEKHKNIFSQLRQSISGLKKALGVSSSKTTEGKQDIGKDNEEESQEEAGPP